MSAAVNLAAKRARRSIDHLLDAIDRIRGDLDQAPWTEAADRLRDLADRLSKVGITMVAATVVMHEDLDRRFADLKRPRAGDHSIRSSSRDSND
jgi:hypothetical protein